ncbi:MAG TPA: efflux RND transporter periplasmic adaptor subunit [Anaeromyxobacteraceae bacterium]|nr:efflux RND transporter periplasmic adaptor subunit [Anaeromyxobacteraceae bacterium]
MSVPARWPPKARAFFAASRRRSLALGAVAALVAFLSFRALRGREVPAWPVEVHPIVQRVVSSGRVRPPARINLASLVMGRVGRVTAREGDRVAAGQVLVQLEDAEAAASLRQAQARVAEAAARLEQVRGVSGRLAAEALRQAELRVADAESALARARQLADAGGASQAALEDAGRAVDQARSQRDAAAAQAGSTAGGAEARLVAASLSQAESARALAAARLEETRIRAPAAGQVLLREVEPGDVVAAGRTLLTLIADGDLQLVAQVDEKNLALLRPGLPASASADAFPGDAFPAQVAAVLPSVDPSRGTVEVRFRVPSPPPFLRPDMTVSVNVDVGRKERALVIPAEAVRDPTGGPWVLAIDGRRAERRAVRLGLRGDALVEVVAGLAEGEAVIAPAAGWVDPGARVRPRPLPLPGADRAL